MLTESPPVCDPHRYMNAPSHEFLRHHPQLVEKPVILLGKRPVWGYQFWKETKFELGVRSKIL